MLIEMKLKNLEIQKKTDSKFNALEKKLTSAKNTNESLIPQNDSA